MNRKYQKTIYACFIGLSVQAILINFLPLLFITLQSEYNIPLLQITFLITVNFITQLLVDVGAIFFVDIIGYRATVILAHVFSAGGLILLIVLPEFLNSPYTGLFISVITYSIGAGLLEVVLSPIIEACPTDNKEKAMSLLHSFYSWGQVGVVLFSTIFFVVFGIENWKILALLWAIIPLANIVLFVKAPIESLESHGPLNLKALFSQKIFWVFIIVMIAAGASEQSISQWASTFAEQALGISKMWGDLAGPMAFAICMGIARVYYGKHGEKIRLEKFIIVSGFSCASLYLLVALVSNPMIALLACACTGFSVGIMWPGVFSLASKDLKGGTAMFALLALGGDLGCSAGPTVVGVVSNTFSNNFRLGILVATIFPIILVIGVYGISRKYKKK